MSEHIDPVILSLAGSPRIDDGVSFAAVELELENLRRFNRGGRITRILEVVWEVAKRQEKEIAEKDRLIAALRNGQPVESGP